MKIINDNTQPVMCIFIDTTNKSTAQLEAEVTKRVTDEINKKVFDINRKVSESEFLIIKECLINERDKILRQFMFQIRHMKEINKLTKEEVKRDI